MRDVYDILEGVQGAADWASTMLAFAREGSKSYEWLLMELDNALENASDDMQRALYALALDHAKKAGSAENL
jgi:hypothetical protein